MLRIDAAEYATSPGVYLFRDAEGRVLYVGKAVNLRQRLRSYAAGGDGRLQIPVMLRQARGLETILTDSELEALILENNLIKEHRPRYNVFFRDDKSYPFVRVTNEDFPRVFVTRKLVRDGSRYFGPYTEVKQLRGFLRSMRERLRIRECDLTISAESIARGRHKLCLDYHIGKCRGPCEGLQDADDYRRSVRALEALLKGRTGSSIREAQGRMRAAAKTRDFEEAARQRDLISVLEQFRQGQKAEKGASRDELDAVALAREDRDACAVLLRVREGRLLGSFHAFLRGALDSPGAELLRRFLTTYYDQCEQVPARILLPEEPAEALLLETWLTEKRRREEPVEEDSRGTGTRPPAACRLSWPRRGEKRALVKMARSNAQMLLSNMLLRRMKRDRVPESLKALARDLRLAAPPRRIEGFDISHFGGRATVASMVVFRNGLPLKKDYRCYRIRSLEGVDDYAALAEVVKRRYRRLLGEGAALPDLVLVDGGVGQLARAHRALAELGLEELPVIGLAKRFEEVFLPGESLPRNIPRNSSANRLLQHVRDEAHRFALAYSRKVGRKEALPDPLAEVAGVGPVLRDRLLKSLGGLRGLEQATEQQLLEVRGVGPALAASLIRFLQAARVGRGSSDS